MTAPPVKGVLPRRVVVHTTDFDDARRAMEQTFLPMAMWPMEPLAGLNMRLDSARVDEMTTSTVTFGRSIGLRSVESRTYHVAVPVTGVAESQAGLREPIVATQEQAAIFSVDESFAIHWRGDCTQLCLDFPGAVLNSRLEQHLDVPLGKPLAFEAAMDLTTPKGRGWLRMLRLANREARRPHGLLENPLTAKSIEAPCWTDFCWPSGTTTATRSSAMPAPPHHALCAKPSNSSRPHRSDPGRYRCWPRRFTSVSVRCRRASDVPSTRRRRAISARSACARYGRICCRRPLRTRRSAPSSTGGAS